MPPRKSDISKASNGDEGTPIKERDGINIEDLNLPRTLVQRLAKGVLPPNTQIQKDAILAMSKGATVFINYLSSHANENTLRANKKTIAPKDVLEAVAELEFPEFLPRLEAELAKYNEVQTDKRNSYRKKIKDEKTTNGPLTPGSQTTSNPLDGESKDADSPPASKKARRSTLGISDETNGHHTSVGESLRQSGDDTLSEGGEDDVENAEDDENEDEDEEDDDEDENEDEENGDDSREQDPLEEDALEMHRSQSHEEDEALDNGEESD